MYLGCTQRECKVNEKVIDQCREMFESRLSELPGWEKPHAKTVAWSYDMEGHEQKNALKDIVNWQTKRTDQLYKVATPSLVDDQNFKKEELETVGELLHVCSQNFLDMLIFGTNWWTRHSMVCKQTCSSRHQIYKSLCKTLGSCDFLYSSHK